MTNIDVGDAGVKAPNRQTRAHREGGNGAEPKSRKTTIRKITYGGKLVGVDSLIEDGRSRQGLLRVAADTEIVLLSRVVSNDALVT